MSEIEEDFLNILNDLKNKIEEPKKYNNKKSAGLIRQLLLDENPLIDQINRAHQLKINFQVRKIRPATPGIGKIIMEGIVPTERDNQLDIEIINRKDFLNKRCLILHDQIYTVKDIIKLNSNIRGGIHSGKPKTEKEKLAVSMIDSVQVGHQNGELMDLTLSLIYPIAKIVIESLKELESKTKNVL